MPTAEAPRPSDGVPAFEGAVSARTGPGLMNGVIENALLETLRAAHEWAFEMMVRPIRRAPRRGCTTANTQRRRHMRRGPIGVPERLPRAEGVRGRLPTIGLAAPNRGQYSPHETAVAAAKARGSDRGNLVGCQTSNRQTCRNPFSDREPAERTPDAPQMLTSVSSRAHWRTVQLESTEDLFRTAAWCGNGGK